MTGATPRGSVEHPFDRQRRAFFGVIALVLLATLFACGGAATTIETRDAAVDAYARALAEQQSVAGTAQAAAAAYTARADELAAIAEELQQVTAISGEPIPAEASAALEAARQTAAAAAARTFAEVDAEPADLDGLRVPEIEARAAELAAQTEAARPLVDELKAAADDVERASAALGTALGDYVTAVVQRGAALVKAHPNAPSDELNAFRSAVDALPETGTDSLPSVLQAAVAAAAKLG